MYWTKFKLSTRQLFFAAASLGIVAVVLFYGAPADAGKVEAAAAPAATFPADPGSLGAIPDRGVSGCADAEPATNREITFTVSGMSGSVTNVEVTNLTLSHTWMGDIKAILIAPNGANHALFGRTGGTSANACGDSSDLAGPYGFMDSAAAPPSGGWWQAATAAGSTAPLAAGNYRTTAVGPTANPAPATNMNAAFAGVTDANGVWKIRFTDHGGGDTGSVTAASLTITTGGGGTPTADANVDMNGDGKTDWVVVRGTNTPLTEATGIAESPVNRGVGSMRERLAKEGDGSANLGGGLPVYWYTSINGSSTTSVHQLGDSSTDYFVPQDYDGDGKDDVAVWRPGANAVFYIINSSDNTLRIEAFGQTGDDPTVAGDYDGDNKADLAVYRCPQTAGQCYFFFRGSNNNPGGQITFVPFGFGTTNDYFPYPGDFDGDGKYDFCVQRSDPSAPANGQFILLKSSGGTEFINWGLATDVILPGDYDGDGKSDFAVRRTVGNSRLHYILERDGGGTGNAPIYFGIVGDFSVPGDYDGDGKQDIAVWRPNADPTQNFFWVIQSSNGAILTYEWGGQGDYPVANWYVH